MSVVVASPQSLGRLAEALIAGAAGLAADAQRLNVAAEQFVATRPEVGAGVGDDGAMIALEVGRFASIAGGTAADLVRFVAALEAADQAGAASVIRWGFGRADIVVISEALLGTFAVDASTSLVALLAQLRRRRDLLEISRPEPRWPAGPSEPDDRQERLDAVIAQVAAIVDAGRPPGWAGVQPEQWSSAATFFAAAALGSAMALAMRGELRPGGGDGTAAPTSTREALADAAFAHRHPFVAAALEHQVLITPARLAVLVELDRLATSPIDAFATERSAALADTDAAPLLDWSSDSCSGPVVDQAEAHCLQHDFIYRNGRMVRDQWGVPAGFAEALKRFADERFGWAVLGDTPQWPPRPELYLWSIGAGLMVRGAGSVSTPWHPPAPPR